MRARIKTKVIASVAVIVSLALLASGVIAYSYFNKILKKQIMKDESIQLSQTAGQLRYFQNDLRNMAYNILVDPGIQSRMKTIYSSDLYERLNGQVEMSTYLNQFLLLKNGIESIVLVGKDGQAFSTNRLLNDYYTKTLQEEWYRNHEERNVHSGFSEVHHLKRGQETTDIVSYINWYNPVLDAQSNLRELIIHVNLAYITEAISVEREEGYDAYYLLDADNRTIMGNGSGIDEVSYDLPLHDLAQSTVFQKESRKQLITINGMMWDGWKLVTAKPKSAIQRDINSIMYIFILITVVTLIIILLALTPLIHNITRPISKLTTAMKEASMGRLHATVAIRSGDEIELLGEGFNRMLHELQNYISQSIADEKIKQKLQFDLLLSQINPHFIYNTLNTVIYMAQLEGNKDIVQMVSAFIRLLQESVLITETDYQCTVKEEIESVRHYLTIQKFRYPDRFEVRWQIDDVLLEQVIPRTILQPLIENALFHGIISKPEPGTITVRMEMDPNYLYILVEDDGVGIDQEAVDRFEQSLIEQDVSGHMRPIGLANVRDRLRSFYGPAAVMHIVRMPIVGTQIKITIPLTQSPGYYTK
ncbi:cache domain-containing sensor histidine kinase [Paenibacillus methanolicus]|uniref:histidine kinase n=1 Tax=Paenibacillus methanolicus TaxID=582686 RepID=A0A5S5CHU7_9BACL|nr:sensor histidine kinase [Paenibacillus methanolicus]TYP79369.1 two-component system sensor histidine kinase YesM [Paenibacillus methanolicus]